MTIPVKSALDDGYKKLVFNDFSGGWNVYKGILDLSSNESPDLLNCIPFPGRLQYRGGWNIYSTLPHAADQAYGFYDSNGAKHLPVWAGGNLYDVVSGVAVLIEAGVYTAGQTVGRVDLNGILYWSTKTTRLRFWDPVAATHNFVPQNGPSPAPASPFLFIYTNAIVACGVKFGAGAYQPNVFAWSAINDPTTWNVINSQAVGPNNGAQLQFGVVFGIAEIGVAPFRTFIIGRSDSGIYGYQGALGSLQEFLVNCPVGCRDGASALYIPGSSNFGEIIFLGTDAQFWSTNGITAAPVSLPILPVLSSAVESSVIGNPNPRFWAGYNEKQQYYFCDVSGTQFVYKWDLRCWTKFQGWPSGPVVSIPDATGIPALFIASNLATQLVYGQVALDGIADNNVPANVYYKTAYLHAGDPERLKEFHWVGIFSYDTGVQYAVSATSMPRADCTFLQSSTLLFPACPGGGGANIFRLDHSLLNGPDVLGPAIVPVVGSGTPKINHGRLSCPSMGQGVLAGIPVTDNLRGGAAQFTIAYSTGAFDYEIVGLEMRYIDRGYRRDGGNPNFNVEGGIPPVNDIFVQPLQ